MKFWKRVLTVAVVLSLIVQPIDWGTKTVSAANDWMCKTCGQYFGSKVNSHTKVCGNYSYSYTTYTCGTCGYSSSSQSSHSRTVSQDYATSVDHYSCSICGTVSSQTHSRTISQNYSSVSGYKCSGCGSTFSSQQTHTKTCTGSWVKDGNFSGCPVHGSSCGNTHSQYHCTGCGRTVSYNDHGGEHPTSHTVGCTSSWSTIWRCSKCGSSSSTCNHDTTVACSGSVTKYYRCSRCGNVTSGSCRHDVSESCPASSWSSSSVYRCSSCSATSSSAGTHRVSCSGTVVPATHTLSYNVTYNGGSESVASVTEIADGTVLDGNHSYFTKTATKSGWDFVGWNTDSSAKVAISSLTMDDDKTVFAIFKKKITATLNDMNGTAAQQRTINGTLWNKETQATATLPALGARTGWTAVGWKKTQDEQNSNVIMPGESIITEGLVLYGLYKKTVSFDLDTDGDGENDMAKETEVFSNSGDSESNSGTLVLPAEVPKKTGYTFLGWQVNDTGDLHKEASSITVTEGDVVKPVFVANSYTVTFHSNDGTGKKVTQNFKYDQEQNLTSNTFGRRGYTYIGWNTTESAEVKTMDDGKSVINLISEPDGNLDLYAIWSLNKYSIEYEKNQGVFRDDETVVTEYSVEDKVVLPSKLEREGYTFNGWWESGNFTGDNVLELAKGTIGDKKFWAKMTANTYKVTYDANGGVGTAVEEDATYDSQITIKKNGFTREHYHFIGWNTKADGSGQSYTEEQNLTWKIDKDVTLYAQWEGDIYKITFDPTTGSGGTLEIWERYSAGFYADEKCTQGISEIVMPKMVGYELEGYYFGEDKVLSGTGEFTKTCHNKYFGKASTVEAKWTAKHYQVNLNSGGATKKGDESVDAVYDEPLPEVEIPEWTRTVKFNSAGGDEVEDVSANREFLGYYYGTTQYLDCVGNSTRKWDVDEDEPGLMGKWKNTSINLPETRRVGHTFKGWSNSEEKTVVGEYELTQDEETLKAVWERNKYNVVYDYKTNGGTSCSCETKKVLYENPVDLTPEATKPNWDFIGWNTDPDAKDALEEIVIGAEDITLYAIYGRVVKATFVDGMEQKVVKKNIYNGETSSNLEVPEITDYNGWTSLGWTESKENDVEPEVEEGESLTIEQGTNRIFYARYSKVVEASFNHDGGAERRESKMECSSSDLSDVKPGSVIAPISTEVDCRDGFTPIGWLNDLTDYKPDCAFGEEISLMEDREYWLSSKKEIQVEYKNCELSQEKMDVLWDTKTEKSPVLVLPTVSKDGYFSKGWINSFGSQVESGDSVFLNANETFSAVWEPIVYSLSFDGNGASEGAMDDVKLTYDEETNLPKNQYVRKYTVSLDPGAGTLQGEQSLISDGKFTGWKLDNKTLHDEQAVINLTKKNGEMLKLTAIWGNLSVVLPVPEREGYDFMGWKETDNTRLYQGEFIPERDYQLEALWQLRSSNVNVDTQGSTNMANFKIKAIWGKEMPHLENKIFRQYEVTLDYLGMQETKKVISAYKFEGIYSEKDGKGTQYYDGNGEPAEKWDQIGEQTVYVYWQPIAIKLPTPMYDGYLVDGWEYGNKLFAEEFIPEKDCVLEMVRTPKVFKLNLNTDGGTLEKNVKEYTYGKKQVLPIPVRKNYSFLGWFDSANTRFVSIEERQLGDLSLTAKWFSFKEEGTAAGNKDIVNVELPNGMEKIPDGYFENCENLEKVIIPEGYKEIGNEAFKDCTNLKEVTLPSTLEKIGDYAFEGCTSLKKITIPEGCMEIGDGAFKDCKSLLDVDVPASVVKVGKDAFKGCVSLWRISFANPMCEIYQSADTIPASTVIYGYEPSSAYDYARTYGREFVKIGNAYKIVAKGTKSSVSLLVAEGKVLPKTITAPTLVSDSTVVFDGYVMESCGATGKKKAVYRGAVNRLSSVQKGSVVYNNNVSLTKEFVADCDAILIAKLQKKIEGKQEVAIQDTTDVVLNGLKYRTIKNNATVISADKSLTSATILSIVTINGKKYCVTSIAKNAFKGCKKLKKLTVKGNNLKDVGKNALAGTKTRLIIRVTKKNKKKFRKLFTGKGNKSIVIKTY